MSRTSKGAGLGELYRALAVLAEPPSREHARIASLLGLPAPADAETATRLFSLDYAPFASVYVGAEGQVGGEASDRIAGFWRALGEVPPANVDELAVVLGLHATLWDHAMVSAGVPATRARNAFFWEHVASWVVPFATRIGETASPFHRAWSELLLSTLVSEAALEGPPAVTPLHFREAPPLALQAGSTTEEIATAMLVPVRSGLILGRPEVGRLITELQVATRLSSRLHAIRDAIETERAATLHWLTAEASRQYAVWAALPAALSPVTTFWSDRASATAAVLERLAREPAPVTPSPASRVANGPAISGAGGSTERSDG